MKVICSLLLILFVKSSCISQTNKFVFANGEEFNFHDELLKCKNTSFASIKYLDLIGQNISSEDTTFVYNIEQQGKPYVREEIKESFLDNHKGFGQPLSNYIDLKVGTGKKLFLHFAFSKCPPCIKEMPIINRMVEQHDDDFEFVIITFDKDLSKLRSLADSRMKFVQLEGYDIDFRFGIHSYPQTMIFDESLVLQYHMKELNEDFEESYLYELIVK